MLKNFQVCSIPLNFEYRADDRGIRLYFLGANKGENDLAYKG